MNTMQQFQGIVQHTIFLLLLIFFGRAGRDTKVTSVFLLYN